jgi:enoyl-CoA hydratase/carnithine racemase
LTGTGQFFSGGYDIKDFQSFQAANRSDEQYMTSLGAARFFLTLMKFSKPLVASGMFDADSPCVLLVQHFQTVRLILIINVVYLWVATVNGPAIGMAVTLLAFCDYALAHERAFFQTPFVHLSLVPEGCSTLLFPRMIGMRKSTELLLLGRQFSCEDARNCNLVNEVVATDEQLHERAFEICEEFAEIDPLAFERSKKLLQMVDGDGVEKTFLRELRVFGQQLQTAECRQKFEQFFSRKSKL